MKYIATKKPKARKRHQCDFCLLMIEVGEVYDRYVWADGGEIVETIAHPICGAETERFLRYDDDLDVGFLQQVIVDDPESLTVDWLAWFLGRLVGEIREASWGKPNRLGRPGCAYITIHTDAGIFWAFGESQCEILADMIREVWEAQQ